MVHRITIGGVENSKSEPSKCMFRIIDYNVLWVYNNDIIYIISEIYSVNYSYYRLDVFIVTR